MEDLEDLHVQLVASVGTNLVPWQGLPVFQLLQQGDLLLDHRCALVWCQAHVQYPLMSAMKCASTVARRRNDRLTTPTMIEP